MENEIEMQATENTLATLPKNDVVALYRTASSLTISKEESADLSAPFAESIVQIRPDGHIYIPQAFYRQRLNSILGIGQWALVPKFSSQEEKEKSVKVSLNAILVIRTCFMSEAIGEGEMFFDNPNQSLATAWESAKSDAITRCCKDLSIGMQIYDPSYIKSWQQKYAIAVWCEGKTKPQWRRTDAEPLYKEVRAVVGVKSNEDRQPFPFEHPDQSNKWLNKTLKNGGVTGEWLQVTEQLRKGETTIAQLKKNFKINREVHAELEEIVVVTEKYGYVPGPIFEGLKTCNSRLEVDGLAVKHKETIGTNKQLRQYIMDVKQKLPALKKAS